jgi:hypothetical protein
MPKAKKRTMPTFGSVFEKNYGGKTYRLKIVKSSNGIAYEVSGRIFKTPTAAAKNIVKHAVNGWRFWKIGP